MLVVCALDGPSYVFRAAKDERKDIASMVRLAPSSLPLRIQGSLFPHAGYALHLSPLAKFEAAGGESILLDPRSNPFPFTAGEIEAFIDARSRDPRYAVPRSPHGLVLLTPAGSNGAAPKPGP